MTKKALYNTCCSLAGKAKKCLRGNNPPQREISLSHAGCNSRLKVCRLTGDRKLCAKMASLGVVPGQELQIICSRYGENCMVKLGDGTLSLDELASKNIIVTAT